MFINYTLFCALLALQLDRCSDVVYCVDSCRRVPSPSQQRTRARYGGVNGRLTIVDDLPTTAQVSSCLSEGRALIMTVL